ncbi:MAG: VWA domain-containing protein, partial [Candidatus Omnitrophica bacterium]|nr:VWA domain-containing protein [Candidatus Omnitrophota bacterium]
VIVKITQDNRIYPSLDFSSWVKENLGLSLSYSQIETVNQIVEKLTQENKELIDDIAIFVMFPQLVNNGELEATELQAIDAVFGLTPEAGVDIGKEKRSPDEEGLLKERVGLINTVIKGITGDPEAKIEAGALWAYNPETNTFYFPADRLIKEPFQHSTAVSFHDIGHYHISRVAGIEDNFFYGSESIHLLLNGVDDPRANEYEMWRYPGLRRQYLEPLYQEDTLKLAQSGKSYDELGILPHEQFVYGIVYKWFTGKDNPAIKDPEVIEALKKTYKYAEEIFKLYPQSKEPTEAELLGFAEQMERKTYEKIWPEYKKLLKESIQQTIGGLKGGTTSPITPGFDPQKASEGDLEIEAGKIVERESKELNEKLGAKVPRPDLQAAKEGLEKAEAEGKPVNPINGLPPEERNPHGYFPCLPSGCLPALPGKGQQPGQSPQGPPSQGASWSLESRLKELEKKIQKIQPLYQKYLQPIARLVEDAVNRLRNILEMDELPIWEGRFQTGHRFDFNRWMQKELTGRIDVFKRKITPQEREHKFSLIIDQSGSMGGEKSIYARDAIVFFMETLSRLGIDFNIIGFSDDHWQFKKFGHIPSIFQKEEIINRMEGDISGKWGGTNDLEAVKFAVEEMRKQSAETRVIIVITDGDGNLKYNKQILDEAEKENIKIIGVGIGPGMAYVVSTYKYSLKVDEFSALPRAIADILVRCVLRH